MTTAIGIGDFARMTLLSVKALRHYHEVGLLTPAAIDPASGYRRYDLSQVATAIKPSATTINSSLPGSL